MKAKEKDWCDAAARLAQRLHKGQTDKAGADYFESHLTTVAGMGETWLERVAGYLHDAAEDTPNSVGEVLSMLENEGGNPLPTAERQTLATALHLLNHHNAPERESYIRGIAQNPLATAVKLHDLSHNMDLSRLPNPTPKDLNRLERYKYEYAYLQDNGVPNSFP